jgi:hypothetical protein
MRGCGGMFVQMSDLGVRKMEVVGYDEVHW